MAGNIIIIHFAGATWDEISPWLDLRATRRRDRMWNYPENDYTLRLYDYPDICTEYEPGDLESLRTLLGGMPSLSLCLELRRSRGNPACDRAEELILSLLSAFSGVVDDNWVTDHYWVLGELESGNSKSHGRFLDCYRTQISDA
ncbi:MAG: hypothetical protein FWD68_09690 [Alphaproteobacteria bacterium]|nr:hypothetical protein [Alphaproteobacteria bacterium]